ncbi:hypothetical protein DM02DRAFT_687061 [Periconia macrospinosa]|uniref:F-box domain-containing protein n=1 Tax=Periconia macrospinosa TaxID=97972 RepID=A0A2V1DFD3_9PLEO|nr:hypothetical protein DM02DRAFT_687061 [Periconia macrospinosa]
MDTTEDLLAKMAKLKLLSLPTEVLIIVASQNLPNADLANLSLTCRKLYPIAQESLYSPLNVHRKNLAALVRNVVAQPELLARTTELFFNEGNGNAVPEIGFREEDTEPWVRALQEAFEETSEDSAASFREMIGTPEGPYVAAMALLFAKMPKLKVLYVRNTLGPLRHPPRWPYRERLQSSLTFLLFPSPEALEAPMAMWKRKMLALLHSNLEEFYVSSFRDNRFNGHTNHQCMFPFTNLKRVGLDSYNMHVASNSYVDWPVPEGVHAEILPPSLEYLSVTFTEPEVRDGITTASLDEHDFQLEWIDNLLRYKTLKNFPSLKTIEVLYHGNFEALVVLLTAMVDEAHFPGQTGTDPEGWNLAMLKQLIKRWRDSSVEVIFRVKDKSKAVSCEDLMDLMEPLDDIVEKDWTATFIKMFGPNTTAKAQEHWWCTDHLIPRHEG